MNEASHRMVPAGTVHDTVTATLVTVFRDFDHAVIPAGLTIDEASIRALISALEDILPGITAYRRELAAEAADDLDGPEPGSLKAHIVILSCGDATDIARGIDPYPVGTEIWCNYHRANVTVTCVDEIVPAGGEGSDAD